jgi:hypothetical protein
MYDTSRLDLDFRTVCVDFGRPDPEESELAHPKISAKRTEGTDIIGG